MQQNLQQLPQQQGLTPPQVLQLTISIAEGNYIKDDLLKLIASHHYWAGVAKELSALVTHKMHQTEADNTTQTEAFTLVHEALVCLDAVTAPKDEDHASLIQATDILSSVTHILLKGWAAYNARQAKTDGPPQPESETPPAV